MRYILIAGPGRSGSTLLYTLIKCTDGVNRLGEIKELELYKRGFKSINRNADIIDISNRAFGEKQKVKEFIEKIFFYDSRANVKIIYLFRDSAKRAISIYNFRKSRGYWETYLPKSFAFKQIAKDFLKPENIVVDLRVNTYVVDFDFLIKCETQRYILSQILEVSGEADSIERKINESVKARSAFLSSVGKLMAISLRRVGAGMLLQKIKDTKIVNQIFFKVKPASSRIDIPSNVEMKARKNDKNMLHDLKSNYVLIAPGIYLHK